MTEKRNGEIKRLFIGLEVTSPWPTHFPKGRILDEHNRHMTLVFLGNISYTRINDLFESLPLPNFKIGQSGYFDKPLFLPKNNPRVVAWHMKWLNPSLDFEPEFKSLSTFLKSNNVPFKTHEDFLPHLTISRAPFNTEEWNDQFIKLPFFTKSLHLYESLGNLQYRSCREHFVHAPFEELEHTADIAYCIYGENLIDIYYNAFTALAFQFPVLLDYFCEMQEIEHLDDVIIQLNDIVGKADMDIGCPFKAISFHGNIVEENHYLVWEMIIDV